MSSYPVVAIIGRPNVGKSTLFNRLLGTRRAIIEKSKGVTRDRAYGDIEWDGAYFTLIDTGGIVTSEDLKKDISVKVREQSLKAIRESDIVVFVVDAAEGLHPLDGEIADILRIEEREVVVVVNKVDNQKMEPALSEFYGLGIDNIVAISAMHGRAVDLLLDILKERLPLVPQREELSGAIKLAIIGRPNVGKSSFLNAVLDDERVLVDDKPGTTRDAIDTFLKFKDSEFILIDTAGIRHRGKIKAGIDYFSSVRTRKAISEADIVLFMIDGYDGIRKDDLHYIYNIWEAKKGMVLGINKRDLIEKSLGEYEKLIKERLPIVEYMPIVYFSAKEREGLEEVLLIAKAVYENMGLRIKTSQLNSFIEEIKDSHPGMARGKKIFKVYYGAQVDTYPPKMVFTVNHPELIKKNYLNFLERRLRRKFGFFGSPINMVFNGKKER
ncbi:MAG: ribosome biogenesis GTPase Der [Candidatus Kaelpia imicola]|nr:ribosome biogenesis GTPase Der [Candidatus Kaelpia imicola]